MRRRTTLALGVLAGAIATTLIGGIAWAAIPSANGTIRACYDGGGTLKVIDEGASCAKNWKGPIAWNQQGVPGADGVSGYEVVQDSIDFTATGAGTISGLAPTLACPEGKVALGGDADGTITDLELHTFIYGPTGGHPRPIVNGVSRWQFHFAPYDHLQAFRAGDHIEVDLYVTCATVD